MSKTAYNISLKGYVGGYDFDRATVDKELAKNEGKQVNVLIDSDTKTMERAAASYAKYNRVDLEDEQTLPYELIVVQPVTATDDPTVLGIKPIPNIQQKISDMIAKYRAETLDIEDVEFEEADLEFDTLFSLTQNDNDDGEETGVLQ